jgi:methylmalonyl-CoA mutase N-terminal domain/subunit
VSIATLADMEKLFQDIPLDQVSTSMTINAPAMMLLALYLLVAEKQGVPWEKLSARCRTTSSRSTSPGHLHLPAGPLHAARDRHL